jgi:hypothetical protein
MIYGRIVTYAAIGLALTASGWKCYTAGQNNIRAAWTAEKLATSETARLREQSAQKSNERVDREYQTAKTRLAADKRATNDRLRDFQAVASASSNSTTASGTDDPYRAIADQCSIALVVLDGYAQSVAGKAAALQSYVLNVCKGE